MKRIPLLLFLHLCTTMLVYAQTPAPTDEETKAITALIDQYSEAREKRDTVLLKKILAEDVDQLVSTGEWRTGIGAAVDGMMKSSAAAPGTRTLRIEKIRVLQSNCALVDCKYIIQNKDGTLRNMWSSFILVREKETWRISAIRNMLPAVN